MFEWRKTLYKKHKSPRDSPLVVKPKMRDKTELGQVLEAIRGMETNVVQLEKTLLQKD